MAKRLTPKQTEEAFDHVAKRDGKRCHYCSPEKRWPRKTLVLHHVDNDPTHNPKDGSNWRITCRSHNHIMNPRGLSKYNSTRGLRIEDLRTSRPLTEEMRRNNVAKRIFLEYFDICMMQFDEVNIDNVVGYVVRKSQDDCPPGIVGATVERYIDDMVRGDSPYYLDDESNCIRKHPVSAEAERTPDVE